MVEQIGRYQLLDLLGQGGMGQVYQARDPHLDREVVVKLVKLAEPGNTQSWRLRFQREVQAAGRLNHPHIVTVHDVNLEHDPPYLVMELLSGGTLRQRLGQELLPWPRALTLFRPLLHALAYAHQAGIIHRDLKPSNLMFSARRASGGERLPALAPDSETEILKLVDFGLARHLDDQLSLTQAGMVFGTPAYLSPEQARGDGVDARTDIFSMGIILLESITGHNPLRQNSLFATLGVTTSPQPIDLNPLTHATPPAIVHLIERAVAKDREERYATAEAFLTALTACLEDEIPTQETPTPPPLPSPASFSTRFLVRAGQQGPVIQTARHVHLRPEVEAVLRVMFRSYSRLAIETEFGQGLSGGHVFRVRPIEAEGKAHLPTVVKIAPINLIRREWQAYQSWVINTLPGVARLESAPTLPPGSLWDGLRYTLVGGGAFEVQTLTAYYRQATPQDLEWVLTERLYQMVGVHWWLERHLDRAFQMQSDYDAILPVNLHLRPLESRPNLKTYPITPEHLPLSALMAGDLVHLAGFVVTEIDFERQEVTLDLPPRAQERPGAAYRLRLVEPQDIHRYQVGQIVDALTGQVAATRHDLLAAAAGRALGDEIDLTAETLTPPPAPDETLPETLPNPLLAYQDMLQDFTTVHISTIHGDLNLENILLDPETRHLNLIDFATVRQGHALHDLLRLETELLTKLLPPALTQAELPPSMIYPIYRQLHLAARHPDRIAPLAELPPGLEKPVRMLAAIRKMARTCLFNPEDWTEYYQGLTLYLLGSLKFKNLDDLPAAPLPKQIAFWGAASLVDLLNRPPQPVPPARPKPIVRWPLLLVAVLEAVVIVVLALGLGWFNLLDQGSPLSQEQASAAAPGQQPLAAVIGLEPEARLERSGAERLRPVDLGQYLYEGDLLSTRAGGVIYLVCHNGYIYALPEWRTMAVTCGSDSGGGRLVEQLDPALGEQVVARPDLGLDLATVTGQTSRQAEQQRPLLLSPRNSAILDPRPTFHWQPVAAAGRYRLAVRLADGHRWQQETTASALPYPAAVPPLSVAGPHLITVTLLASPPTQDQATVRLLPQTEQQEVVAARRAIETLPLNEPMRIFLLAQLYQSHGLWTPAIAQLESLTEQGVVSAGLWQQLGQLYEQVGLYLPAEESYTQALTLAQGETNLQGQAAAQVGLARLALRLNEPAPALEYLAEAEALYRRLGQPQQADSLAAIRERWE